jgi:hypothetical protein
MGCRRLLPLAVTVAVAQGPRRAKKKEATYLPLFRFFEIFRSDFRKYFYGVLGLLMQRNGKKTRLKKSTGRTTGKEKKNPQLFWPKVFDMDFPQKVLMVLLNSPC